MTKCPKNSLFALGAMFLVACTQPPQGEASVCYAVEAAGEDELPYDNVVEAVHEGVTSDSESGTVVLMPRSARYVGYQECVSALPGVPVTGEFIDAAGVRFRLAVSAMLDNEQLVPKDIFASVENSTFDIALYRGWGTSDFVTIFNDTQPLLALQSNTIVRRKLGPLKVDRGGADALPALDMCGSSTAQSLQISDDSNTHTLSNGETVSLRGGGAQYLATNIYGIRYVSNGGCTDGPEQDARYTWLLRPAP